MRSETFALGIRTVSGNIRIARLGGRCIAISMKKSTWNKNFIKLTRMVNTFIFMTTPETRHRFVIPDTQKFIFGFLVFTLMKALSVCKSPIEVFSMDSVDFLPFKSLSFPYVKHGQHLSIYTDRILRT